MRTRYRQREHKEHGISRPDSISSTSSINRKYNPASLTASRDEGGSNINAPVIYDEIFTSPSTSSTLSSSNTLSTTSDEMEDWNLRPPPMPFLTPNQLWFGRSTQTIVTLTDVNGKFIYGK
ncbi:hypothetical protein K7432_010526 [Basidiobolus ranarum]|uniref:Uncharacterized protein n=1 Tax=Basidiobolus ranarum TaxID=34480 RepID=A0ABR2WNQ8_9FUNG